jgi:uncharacterized protein (TIGR02996 family)
VRAVSGRRRLPRPGGKPPRSKDADARVVQAPKFEPVRNRELEQAICDHWDDDAAWSVYADWLLARGDPYGELLSIELALETATNRAKRGQLEQARLQLCQRHIETFGQWFAAGETRIEIEPGVRVRTRRGFITEASFAQVARRYNRPQPVDLRRAIENVMLSPGARVLRKVEAGGAAGHSILEIVGSLEQRASLRALSFRDRDATLEWVTVLAIVPELCELQVEATELELAQRLVCPRLETLRLELARVDSELLEGLVSAELTSLRTLEIAVGLARSATDFTLAELERLFASPGYPALENLRLRTAEPELLGALARSPLLSRLRTLELDNLHYDEGLFAGWAEQLLANVERFARLERIELRNISLATELDKRLARALPNVTGWRPRPY